MTTYGTESSGASSSGDGLTEKASTAAADVGEGAKNVAGVAKDQAASVVHEAKSAARGLLSDARTQLSDQASTQKQRAADGLRDVGSQFSSMAEGAPSGPASTLVRGLSRRADSAATWLADREPGDIVQDVRGFARRNTGLFLAIAAGVGVVAGRVVRALREGEPDDTTDRGGVGAGTGTRLTGGTASYDDTPLATAVATGRTGGATAAGYGSAGSDTASAGTGETGFAAPADAVTGDAWTPGEGQGDRP